MAIKSPSPSLPAGVYSGVVLTALGLSSSGVILLLGLLVLLFAMRDAVRRKGDRR